MFCYRPGLVPRLPANFERSTSGDETIGQVQAGQDIDRARLGLG